MTNNVPAESAVEAKRLVTLKKRAQYLAVRSGKRIHRKAFVLEVGSIAHGEDAFPRFGFTITKKVGNAVVRNRIRRRLKEAVRACLDRGLSANRDCVVIGKRAALSLEYKALVADLSEALVKSGNGQSKSRCSLL